MSKLDALLIDARGSLAKNFGRPSFTAADYDDGVLAVAQREKRADETVAQALDRLVYVEKNDDVRTLYSAARRAETFVDRRPGPEQIKKSSDGQDAVLAYAKEHARPGESDVQSLDRLARAHDPELRQLYAAAV